MVNSTAVEGMLDLGDRYLLHYFLFSMDLLFLTAEKKKV